MKTFLSLFLFRPVITFAKTNIFTIKVLNRMVGFVTVLKICVTRKYLSHNPIQLQLGVHLHPLLVKPLVQQLVPILLK